MEYKFTRQKNSQDCGLAVCSMVINFLHKTNLLLEEVRFENSIRDGEMTMYDIENLLLNHSIEFKSYMADFNEFIQLELNFPLIVNVKNQFNMNHYVVIYKRTKNKILIADPSKFDFYWINIEDFKIIYNGYFGWARKITKHIFNQNLKLNSFKLMFDKLNLIIIFFVLSIFMNVSIILSSGFLRGYSTAIQIKDYQNINYVFITYISIFLLQIILGFIVNRIINLIAKNLKTNFFKMYVEKLISMDNDKFLSLTKEEWLTKSKYLNATVNYICDIFLTIPTRFILFLISIITISFISSHLLLLLLIEICISFFISYVFQFFIKERIFENETNILDFTSNFNQLLDGKQEIQSKNLNNYIQNNVQNSFNKLVKNENFVMYIKDRADLVLKITSRLFYLLIFYTSSNLIFNEQLEFSQLLFYISISNYITGFTTSILNLVLSRHDIHIAEKQIQFLFELKYESEDENNAIETIESITLNKLFVFQNDKVILNDLNLIIKENTFITGKSGIGKTTLLKVISSLTNKYEGEVIINQLNLKSINKKNYLNKVQYLGQYDFLFNGSVWQNLQMFQNDIDLKLFHQFNFLDILSNNNIVLEKNLLNNGANLSKGQRQIINFMSLFFTSKDVYLLDEPLSNVDWKTAHRLMKLFIEYKNQCLIILVDHNISYQQYFRERIEL